MFDDVPYYLHSYNFQIVSFWLSIFNLNCNIEPLIKQHIVEHECSQDFVNLVPYAVWYCLTLRFVNSQLSQLRNSELYQSQKVLKLSDGNNSGGTRSVPMAESNVCTSQFPVYSIMIDVFLKMVLYKQIFELKSSHSRLKISKPSLGRGISIEKLHYVRRLKNHCFNASCLITQFHVNKLTGCKDIKFEDVLNIQFLKTIFGELAKIILNDHIILSCDRFEFI
uniref:Uncharacterized protein n=1 Tax=Rhizophagus irregularis (strain DAOM 181602 / DAOM 197198 / MUCL 43194) TaxID=747089 RepID=U9UNV5_RHIID